MEPGCKGMAEDGVMDDIDIIISLHVDKDFPVGTIGINEGGQGGNSMGFTVDFYGTASHAAQQHRGKDAIAMAMEAYMAMEMMAMKEVNPVEPRLLNIGSIHGGNTNNILCDHCSMFGSSRTHSDEVSQYMIDRIKEICEGIAACNGGRAEVKVVKFLPYVINDPAVCALVRRTAEKVLGPERIGRREKRTLGGEDFSFLCRRKPGMMFRLGSAGENPDTHTANHSVTFDIDEACLMVGVDMFTQFVLDNMNGL